MTSLNTPLSPNLHIFTNSEARDYFQSYNEIISNDQKIKFTATQEASMNLGDYKSITYRKPSLNIHRNCKSSPN